jgi:hypothetical protein
VRQAGTELKRNNSGAKRVWTALGCVRRHWRQDPTRRIATERSLVSASALRLDQTRMDRSFLADGVKSYEKNVPRLDIDILRPDRTTWRRQQDDESRRRQPTEISVTSAQKLQKQLSAMQETVLVVGASSPMSITAIFGALHEKKEVLAICRTAAARNAMWKHLDDLKPAVGQQAVTGCISSATDECVMQEFVDSIAKDDLQHFQHIVMVVGR